MEPLIVYQKPTCSTCRKVIKLLESHDVPFTAVNYYETPFTKPLLTDLLKKAGLKARDILRSKEDLYKSLQLKAGTHSEDELIDLILKHPDLLQRPLVQKGDKAILARPPETILDFIKS